MELEEKILENLNKDIREHIIETKIIRKGRIMITIKKDSLRKVAKYLEKLGFDTVITLSGVDYIKENKMGLVYHLEARENRDMWPLVLLLKVFMERDEPRIESLIDIWPSLYYEEKEVHEMFGIIFEGHPDLGPLYLEDWEDIPPLRKDFKLPKEDPWIRAGKIK